MQTLRWFLGVITAVGTLGFLALIVLGDGFRRSFGASENDAVKVVAILLVQAALLASIMAPNQKMLMHGTACGVATLIAGCVWVCREAAFVGTAGIVYCAVWGVYYWQAVWQ